LPDRSLDLVRLSTSLSPFVPEPPDRVLLHSE
jgi:hypothetical protein